MNIISDCMKRMNSVIRGKNVIVHDKLLMTLLSCRIVKTGHDSAKKDVFFAN